MTVHVAIIRPPYDRLILEGRKRIECRLTQQPRPPFGCIAPGQRLYFKRSSGPFVAVAEVARVLMVDALTPTLVDQLAQRYDRWICGDAAYWKQKRADSRYATLIWLRNVKPTSIGPRYKPQNMRAWYVLDDDADPMRSDDPSLPFEVTLTDGAFRQDYIIVRNVMDRLDSSELLRLRLDDGPKLPVVVRLDRNKQMIRWLGWSDWFARHRLEPGDRVQFNPQPDGSLVVRAVHS